MSGFAMIEQTQPHLINNIIVHLPSFFSFPPFLFFLSISGSGCVLSFHMTEPEGHCHHPQDTKHESKPSRSNSNTRQKTKINIDMHIFKKSFFYNQIQYALFVKLFFCN